MRRTTDRAKASGVSESSFLDLKAHVEAEIQDLSRKKAAGQSTSKAKGTKRMDKQLSEWSRMNPGVQARNARDLDLAMKEELDQHNVKSAQSKLTEKVKIYDDLKEGGSATLSEKQRAESALDLDHEDFVAGKSDGDDDRRDEEEEDRMVETKDEFGRDIYAPLSELERRGLILPTMKDKDEDPNVLRGYAAATHFPTFEPSAERREAIQTELAESQKSPAHYYDSTLEVRTRGAGAYNLPLDKDERERALQSMADSRAETNLNREATGAITVKPGEVEGMVADGPKRKRGQAERERAKEARKQEIKNYKKKRTKGPELDAVEHSTAPRASETTSPVPALGGPKVVDPFAALEATVTTDRMRGNPSSHGKSSTEADAFLAGLNLQGMSHKRT
ncbi:uncharacterized protein BXZ73DRAFT_96234 [Epithele typhae]|uniref:uncharacterized protein n=1 Tax=Epithele typhae TaxID=378194 RepID=UPI002007B1ED|nr:uncharacterized protein BXZ73DRAFT_96234 [Epithele typhae]KAH9945244.1 hypothetical protein BXZ73DRAFT_96234 [Epithele typhae]